MMAPQQTQKDDLFAQQYKLYLQQKAQREADAKALAVERAAEKTKKEAYYRSTQKPPKTVATRKPHPCHSCSDVIPAGQTVIVEKIFWRDGNLNLHSENTYFCGKCKPAKEA
jgi:hypothetical protein